MPFHIGGLKATKEELRAYAEKLQERLLQLNRELAGMADELHNENAIKLLSIQQDRMANDIREINVALNKVADALSDLAVLEQKHSDAMDAIKRAHSRIDRIENDFKESKREYEHENRAAHKEAAEKIQKIELHIARTAWLERIGVIVAMAAIGGYIKGF